MPRWFFTIICLLFIQLLLPVNGIAARGRLTGSAELLFAGQTVETAGVKTLDASHFVQQYSLLWTKKNKLNGGRMGEYDVALGYEWSWVDSEVNGQKVKIDNPLDKLLYRGDITLAPGGLPFRLHAFSYDMHQTTFNRSDLGVLFANDEQASGRSGIITDVNNGTRITSGITLKAGVRNGHYQGQFRDLLATLPRLLIDYKQQVVRDVKGPSPQDYVDRDLAFVSLNKKNNWLHYHRFEHIDKVDPQQNFTEDTVLLGTVDHTNRRQWVNLTNWIQVSTDIAYQKSQSEQNLSGLGNSRRYDVNFFAKAKRTRWQLDSFTNFSRIRTQDRLEHELEVPFYARGELNRDTNWRFQLATTKFSDRIVSTASERVRDSIYLKGQVEAFRQARYIVRPLLELETKSGTEGEGQSGRAAVEFFSNKLYRSDDDLFARYDLAYFSGIGTSGADTSFVEQSLNLKVQRKFNTFMAGTEQQLVYGTGRYESSVSEYVQSEMAGVVSFTGGGAIDDNLLRWKSNVYVELSEISRLRNRIDLTYELISSTTVNADQVGITHRLDYRMKSLAVTWNNGFVTGDGMPNSGPVVDSNNTLLSPGDLSSASFSYSISSKLRFNYSPGRSSQFKVVFDYESLHYSDNTDIERMSAEEAYEYTLWHVNGQVRKLLVVGEKAEYDRGSSAFGEPETLMAFSVYGNYFPTAKSLLSARIRYEDDGATDTQTLLTYLSAGINYEKLQVSLDYSYGRRPDTATSPEMLEHKWEVKVKKTF